MNTKMVKILQARNQKDCKSASSLCTQSLLDIPIKIVFGFAIFMKLNFVRLLKNFIAIIVEKYLNQNHKFF